MKYFVVIEETKVIEVDAFSEDSAVENVKGELDNQNPRNTAKVFIAKEIKID